MLYVILFSRAKHLEPTSYFDYVGVVNLKRKHVCVECKVTIPIYQKYLCETCFQEMLNYKLQEEEKSEKDPSIRI